MADDRNYGSSYLALTCAGFAAMLTPTAALAQDAAEAAPTTLKGVTVTDTAIEDETKSEELASPRYTRPLLDTPQTVTVITDQVLLEQNLLTLRDALSTVPGITFGAGEGGGGYGDSINLRGYSANGDILVDGVRDSAQYTRTDPFNLEQIEVSNGANSVYSGTGSVGGTINLVSKVPARRDATTVTAGIGTDNYYRATADVNKVFGNLGFRVNAMYHENDVPARDVERYKRWGIAPSLTLGLDEPTRLTISYVHQEDDNTPQYGVPYYKNAVNDGPLPGADREGYYGYADVDAQETSVDSVTAIFAHDFSETLGIRNLARYQKVTQFVLLNPPQGTYCLANGRLPTGAVCAAPTNAPGTYYPSGPRGTTRDSVNDLFYNQLDLNAEFDTGGITHSLVVGGSFSKEDYHLDSGNSLRNPLGATPNPALPTINIADPNPIYGGPVNFIRTAATEGDLEAWAVYLFDTIALNEQFEINGGIRYEDSDNRVTSLSYANSGALTAAPSTFGGNDKLFSYRVGAVYKPVPNASIYIATSNSENPSRTSVNGGCTQSVTPVAGAPAVTVNLCNIEPEQAKSYEAGIKWNLFEDRLQLNGALFRNERSNYRVASNDPTLPDPVLDGKSRVDGFALGASGEVNDRWTIFANYTYLDSKVVQNISDRCRDNPAAAGCGTVVDVTAGNPLTNTPKHSGSLWTTYEIFDGFSLGYGFTYQGSFFLNNGAAPLFKSDDYWVHRAYASYEITEGASLQLNVTNLTDETYYTRIRNNGWATPGEGRAAILTLNYAF
ncbi:TonB-dependent receptor [Sphingoaurantiacus capsulatus]|uniref:TonB-dependent receptor n=1 Tax=Sphingoaurantiacus capsulatus TaxID=1771310 RepID=A0ABV7X7Q0_9SPHN